MQKGKMHPGTRITSTEQAIKIDKRKNVPAPGKYENMPKERIQKVPKTTDNQIKMNDHCKYVAMQTPGAMYDH
jgi:hypothetical protein